MIDIHTHIMPGVDDGAKNLDMALQMMEEAAQNGTREIIFTPHCAPSYGFFNYDGEVLARIFERICRVVEKRNLPIRVHPGMEILFEGRKEFLYHKDEYYPLCGGRYFLIEYFFDVPEDVFLEGIDTVREIGFEPIIAHPERYNSMQQNCLQKDGSLMIEAKKRGALFQINKGSLSGQNGEGARQTGEWLLRQDLADFVASDAHHPQMRNSKLDRVATYIRKQYGEAREQKLFYANPKCVIENTQIDKNR